MIELEAKIRIREPEKLSKALMRMNAQKKGRESQEDVYFNAPHRDFALTDEALRVRYAGGSAEITYKGPKMADLKLKARIEVNIGVDSGRDCEQMLELLGFTRVMEVKKVREIFEMDATTISIDTVEGLGCFIEIEVVTDGDLHQAEKKIEAVQKKIGIVGPSLTESYLELLLKQ
jgi:adenylate cyclase class 2